MTWCASFCGGNIPEVKCVHFGYSTLRNGYLKIQIPGMKITLLSRVLVGVVFTMPCANFIFLWGKDLSKAAKAEIKHPPLLCPSYGLQSMVWKKQHLRVAKISFSPLVLTGPSLVLDERTVVCELTSVHIFLLTEWQWRHNYLLGSHGAQSLSIWVRLTPLWVLRATGETNGNDFWVGDCGEAVCKGLTLQAWWP